MMESKLNKLLARQIKRHFGNTENIPDNLKEIVEDINNSYNYFEEDIQILQNSIEISSQELRDAFQLQKQHAKNRKKSIDKIKEIIHAFTPNQKIDKEETSDDTSNLLDSLIKLVEEQKNAEDEILKLSLAIDQNPASIVITNTEGNIEYVNPKFCQVSGYSREELIGKNPRILKKDNNNPEFYKNLWETILKGEIWKGEFVNKKKTGELFYELASISAVKNKNGEIVNFLAIKEDITENHQKEKERVRQSALINSLFNFIPDLIFFKNTDGVYMECNPMFAEFVGKPKDKIIGSTDYELFDKQVADTFRKYDLKMLNEGKPRQNEEWVTYPDGRKILLDTLKSPYWEKKGELLGILGISRNITEKRTAQLAFKNSELRFEMLSKHSRVYSWEVDKNGLYTYLSKSVSTVLGFEPNELIGKKHFYDLIPDNFREQFMNEEFEAFKSKKSFQNIELPFVDKYNNIIWVSASGIPKLDEKEAFLGYSGTDSDITVRKLAEEALFESSKKWEAIITASPDGIGMISFDGKIQFMSDKLSQMFGYPVENKDENIGKSIFEFIDPSYHQILKSNFQQLIAGKKDLKLTEYLAVRKDQSRFYIDVNSTVLYDTNGKPTNILFIERDITDRKKAEERLLLQTEMQKVLMNMASDFINIPLQSINSAIEKSLKEMGEFVQADRSYIFSYDFEKQTTTNDFEWCNEGIEPAINDLKDLPLELFPDWVNTHIKGEIMYVEDVFALPKNSLRNILEPQGIKSLLTVPMMNENECIGFVGFDSVKKQHTFNENEIRLLKLFSHMLVNITNRVESEKRLIQTNLNLESATQKANEMAKNAEMANKSKSIFLANMSHEIRTPLNAIIGFSQLLHREKTLSNTQKEYITSISQAGEHLLALINDILELSKMEAGRLELNPVHVNLFAVFDDIQLFFKEQIHAKHLGFKFDIDPGVPKYVIIDDHKLRRIFVNLIGNAVKFTEKGFVAVRINVEDIDDISKMLKVEVEDTGQGISKNEINKLFQHFVQTSSGISKSTGTGLGLALSRELAIMMGGNISVKSDPGKGSVFTFWVMFSTDENKKETSLVKREITAIKENTKKYRILVVDDKIENRIVVVRLLNMVGFETLEAINGKDAIEKFNQWDPHLILMDIRMPVMDGYEATLQIKSTVKGKKIPIIALTASSLSKEKNKALQMGMQGHIGKPFRENELLNTIGSILKIKYIYKDEKEEQKIESFKNQENIFDEIYLLPEDQILQMKRAVEIADFDHLLDLVNNCSEEHSDLAKELKKLVDNYDYEYLEQVLNARTSENE